MPDDLATIYKYFPPERIDSLEEGTISFTPPGLFNDPFDMNPSIDADVSDEYLEARYRKHQSEAPSDLTLENFKAVTRANKATYDEDKRVAINEMLNRKYGVSCFTELNADILMWSHYAKQHEGFVIEFDMAAPGFGTKIERVNYVEDRPRIVRPESSPLWNLFVLAKSEKWEQEREWRMVEELSLCEQRTVNPCSIPRVIFLKRYHKEYIRRIICGLRMSAANKTRLRENLKAWGFSGCKLEELRLHPHSYEFVFSEIPLWRHLRLLSVARTMIPRDSLPPILRRDFRV